MKKTCLFVGLMAAASFVSSSAFAGDAAKGEAIFKKCAACHQVGPEAENKVGPQLTAVVGRQVASVEGYKYGKSIVALGETGLTWTEEELDAYLVNPKKYLRAKLDDKKAKSKMSFKLKKEAERADVIAYLATFSPAAEEGDASSSEGESTTTN